MFVNVTKKPYVKFSNFNTSYEVDFKALTNISQTSTMENIRRK